MYYLYTRYFNVSRRSCALVHVESDRRRNCEIMRGGLSPSRWRRRRRFTPIVRDDGTRGPIQRRTRHVGTHSSGNTCGCWNNTYVYKTLVTNFPQLISYHSKNCIWKVWNNNNQPDKAGGKGRTVGNVTVV